MNTIEKDWFCHKCSLQFWSKHIYILHLKALHIHKNTKRSNKTKHELNEATLSDKESDSNDQIASDQEKKKTFKCKLCQYYGSQRDTLKIHNALVHERKKPFKCEFCNYTYSTN